MPVGIVEGLGGTGFGGTVELRRGGTVLSAVLIGVVGPGGGTERCSTTPFPVMVPGRSFLNARQHSGQRHSTSRSPFAVLERVSLQPNCALMSV